jgi:hypothetical protein
MKKKKKAGGTFVFGCRRPVDRHLFQNAVARFSFISRMKEIFVYQSNLN